MIRGTYLHLRGSNPGSVVVLVTVGFLVWHANLTGIDGVDIADGGGTVSATGMLSPSGSQAC